MASSLTFIAFALVGASIGDGVGRSEAVPITDVRPLINEEFGI